MSKVLLFDGTAFVLSRPLIKHVGLEEALVLQQIHYWTDPKRSTHVFNDKHWVHNTYEQWQKQFSFWHLKKIQRLFRSLEEKSLLISFSKCNPLQKTKYYTINYEQIEMMKNSPPTQNEEPLSLDHMVQTGTPKVSICFSEPTPPNGVNQHPKSVPSHRTNLSFGVQAETNSSENNHQTLDLQRSDTFGRTHLPDLSSCSEKEGDFQEQHPKIGRYQQDKTVLSYNTYTETTDIEEREEKKEEEKEKNKKEKEFEKDLEKKSDPLLSSPCQQMVDLWNRLIQEPLHGAGTEVQLTDTRAPQLESLLQEVLEVRGSSWEGYCRIISQNGFLMGKGRGALKVTFDWAILPKNANKILDGVFQDRRPSYQREESLENGSSFEEKTGSSSTTRGIPLFSPEECIQKLKQHCASNNFPEPWFEVCCRLTNMLGFSVFRDWFEKLVPVNLKGETPYLQAPNAFFRDWILTHYEKQLESALQASCPQMKRFKLAFQGESHV